jgi:serine phosphatase RsbU (regulator of sigma subunit)/pSer/pThr/pTyr-binding forkhead associated (FHA) protein
MMSTIPKSTARLIFNTGDARRIIPIDSTPFTIGRGSDCSLSIPHPQVSRQHACIEHDGSGYIIRDRSSRHGTFVNAVRITSASLHSGDSIRIGGRPEVLVFEDGEQNTTRTLLSRISQRGADSAGESDLEKLSLFLQAAQSFGAIDARTDILRTMLEYSIRLTGAERGFVFLGKSAGALRLECGLDNVGGEIAGEPSISYSIVRDAAESRLDFILSDVTDEIASERESLLANAIRSVVAIPLRCQGSPALLGLLYLDSHYQNRDFNRTGKDILHAIAHQAATLLENLGLIEMERQSALLRKELQIAASIQSQIIPQTLPAFAFAHLAARTIPCTGIGGDFYDVIPVPDGFVAIVADVSGKGVPAALLASMAQGMFHAQTSLGVARGLSLLEAVEALNTSVCARTPREKYLTMAALRYTHVGSGSAQIELVNGGHVAPMIVRQDGTVEMINDGDLPVGLLDFARFHVIDLTLSVGDRIVLVTDGITEAEDAEGTQFGVAQLHDLISAQDPVASVFSAVERFCEGTSLLDDQTMLVIQQVA